MKKFRPQLFNKSAKLRNKGIYNFTEWRTIKSPMHKIFAHLHYLGSHSYQQDKWSKIERKFLSNHRSLDV